MNYASDYGYSIEGQLLGAGYGEEPGPTPDFNEFVTREHKKATSLMGCVAFTFGLEDRHYGGPEEGGWWYDSFQPIRVFVCRKEREDVLRRRLMKIRDEKNKFMRPTSSVLSTGWYAAYEGIEEASPKERPRYE